MFVNKRELVVPKVEPVKFVHKSTGFIKGYAVNTFQGLVKQYNEDRVSIIMNITKPNFKGRWPKCSYFGVFDGHGGDACSNFLKDNMHKYITENQHFPTEPIEALKAGFKKAETEFIKVAQTRNPVQTSGSCALVILVIDQMCYVGNVGDSRAILSSNRGEKVYSLSFDHKPECPGEKDRIEKAGGKIYQSSVKTKNGFSLPGPFRISPGKLSVSRSFGDIQAKLQRYGGNPRVLIAKPEITYFAIDNQTHDFIVVGSDGIYDKLSNEQIVQCFWERHQLRQDGYSYIGQASSKILTQSMNKLSMDNLTSLIIVFQDEGRLQLPRNKKQKAGEGKQNKNLGNVGKQHLKKIQAEKEVATQLKVDQDRGVKAVQNYQNSHVLPLKKQRDEQVQQKRIGFKEGLKKDYTLKTLPNSHKVLSQQKSTLSGFKMQKPSALFAKIR